VVSVLTWKLRITVLWIFLAVCQSAGMVLLIIKPGAIRDLMAGQLWGTNIDSAAAQINIALIFLVPMAMAYLTLVLNDAANRWTNAVLGGLGAFSQISLLIGQPAGTPAGVNFVSIVGSLVALLIVWHAWKWPRRAEVPPPRQSQETTRQTHEPTRH
jgi:Family of unknown function (DUF6326)